MSDSTPAPIGNFGAVFERPEDDWIGQPLINRFEQVVARHGDKVAVDDGVTRLTYWELRRAVFHLAHHIAALVPLGRPVGILLPIGAHFPVAALACLAVGRPYVPIDPSYPAERNEQLVREAGLSAVIVNGAQENIPYVPASIPYLNIVDSLEDTSEPKVSIAPSDGPAVILYTSGSSGQPKGICYDQRAILERVANATTAKRMCSDDRVFLLSSPGTIGGLRVPFLALLNGATLHWADPRQIGIDGALRFLQYARPTTGFAVPALLRTLLGLPGAKQAFTYSRVIRTGGDVLLKSDLTLWQNVLPVSCRIFITLTSTEMPAVFQWLVPPEWKSDGSHLPVGYPRPGMNFTIVDDNGAPVPVGETGELVVKSRHLALGHWQNGRLQSGPFLTDPDDSTVRIFKTGDLVRMREDGLAEMVGRKDRRLKIRGFRIEPGEIEDVLRACAGVADAALIARKTGEEVTALVAYVVPSNPADDTLAEALRKELATRFPLHMRPSQIRLIDVIPQLPGFKVDIAALEKLDEAQRATVDLTTSAGQYVAPRNSLEEIIAGVWREVLKLERVGVHDDFFELGGQSLLAAQVLPRLATLVKVDLSLREFFEKPTVSAIAAEVARRLDRGETVEVLPIALMPRGGDRGLPLSFAQQRLWFLDRLLPDKTAYNIPMEWQLRGQLDVPALQRSLDALVARHDVLRTRFVLNETEPVQIIDPPQSVTLPLTNLSAMAQPEREIRARQIANAHARQAFDLESGPLLRAQLLRLAAEEHLLLVNVHHIVFDGWSVGVFERECFSVYGDFVKGHQLQLPVLPIQYADYALWQRGWLKGEMLARQIGYWKAQLTDLPTLELPTDRPRPALQTTRGSRQSLLLPQPLGNALQALSQQVKATQFMALLAIFQILLYRYTGQADISVGSPIADRNRPEFEGLIGFFVNTLVLRTDLAGNPSFRELLGRVRDVALGAYAHQDLPFEKLVAEIQPERNLSQTPLFQVMFAFQNVPVSNVEVPGLTVHREFIDHGTAMFDLTLFVFPRQEGLRLWLEYNTDLFDAATITRMLGHFRALLEGIVANPDQHLSELPLLTEPERQQLLVEWNDTARNYNIPHRVHRLIEQQVARTPDSVALEFEGRELTYSELNCRANQLARVLRKRGVGPDVLVGVFAERSFEMVVALLAVLKAGGAYVPLDPSYPAERLGHMLEDARANVVLAQPHLASQLPTGGGEKLLLDASWATYAGEASEDLEDIGTPLDLAYVIFTSGSTGRPKGAMNEHRGICNRLLWMQEEYGLNGSDRVMQNSPFGFDISVWEFFGPLLTGARLVIARPEGHMDSTYLVKLIRESQITTIDLVPSMLRVILEEEGLKACASLKRVFCGGEALTYELQERFFEQLTGVELHNIYGPAEAAVDVTYWACRQGDKYLTVPIGRPVANTQIYLLDTQMQPVPVGVAGELYVGGVQVGRGYVGRDDLTAERFVPDPFSTTPKARLYKTGDLARYHSDGAIEYLGRLDFQVKIRGQRIELGEIEATLDKHAGVGQSLVMAREDTPGDQRLVAYVVLRQPAPSIADLKEHLSRELPVYMVPNAFVLLDVLPLNPNGKVDRKLLPVPERASQAETYVAPRNDLEISLTTAWERVLGLTRVGINDNFFELGGNSLDVIRLIFEMGRASGIEIALGDVFRFPTIATMVTQLSPDVRKDASAVVPLQYEGDGLPIFCICGVNLYKDFALSLGKSQPVYGVYVEEEQAIINNVLGGEIPKISIERLVDAYHKAIARFRPHGPYRLAGLSFGGILAMELASRLRRRGEQVDLVFLLDTLLPEATHVNWTRWVYYQVAEIMKGKFREKIHKILTKVRNLLPMHWPQRAATIRANYVDHEFAIGQGNAFGRAAKQWQPRPITLDFRVILFRASDRSMWGAFSDINYDNGWRRYCGERLTIVDAIGGHRGIIELPNVIELGRQAQRFLEAEPGNVS